MARRARDRFGRFGAFGAVDHQPVDPDLAIGVIQIAATIATGHRGANAGDLIFGLHHAGSLEVPDEDRALRVDIGSDVMVIAPV